MRPGSHAHGGTAAVSPPRSATSSLRDAPAVAELFVGMFRRDLGLFYPQAGLVGDGPTAAHLDPSHGPDFRLIEGEPEGVRIDLFGLRYRLLPRGSGTFSAHEIRMVRAIGAVLSLRYQHLFQISHSSRLELYRGGSEDHYVAAFVEPWSYTPTADRPSRIASTIHTLRTAALSTYENRRVSTGALLLGEDDPARVAPVDALPYGVELTSLKSVHRLCDGKRTLFLVDRECRLVEVIDIGRWAGELGGHDPAEAPCARDYTPHAVATRSGGHLCLVLSPNQEIKIFAGGSQQFAFAHGRWRILDPAAKFAVWASAVADPRLARVLFQTALDLAEGRQGGLFVVVDEPANAVGRLLSPSDLLSDDAPEAGAAQPVGHGDPLAKRTLHYLARGRSVVDIDPPVLEALAGLDGAVAVDRSGRMLAFGAILRHDASTSFGTAAEGARTTAALIASRFGPVLKVSEDGVVSCFLGGARVWDL